MIPGDYESEVTKQWKIEQSKKWEKIRKEQRSRESAAEEKRSDSNKMPLIPTGNNSKICSSEKLHNLMKSYGFGGDYDDEEYPSTHSERSPNDDRSDSMNPNNNSYKASMDNRSMQMNRK